MTKVEDVIRDTVINHINENEDVREALIQSLATVGIVPQTKILEVVKPDGKTTTLKNQHCKFETVLNTALTGANIALVGPAGSGKTTLVENVAKSLGVEFYSKSVSAQTSIYEFFGYMEATGKYVPTLFRKAYEEGGIFLVDEFDAGNPNVLASLNQATANGMCAFPDKMVKKHEDFIAVMAGNTYGTGANAEYVGRNKIDAATLDRFAFIELPYDETMELQACTNKEWCKYIQEVRGLADTKKVKCIISPRATFIGEKLIGAGVSIDEVKEMLIFKGLSEDERNLINIDYNPNNYE